jgi:UDP-3-O-[3-hydroxymyristoyl] glucosamine N-acyltransferase
MQEKKYALTSETVTISGITLHRIQALRDFAGIRKGSLGGFIQKESNLSHYGNSWVFNDAKVFGNACVCDDALVAGRAIVRDYAQLYDNVVAIDDAEISGEAMLHGDAVIMKNAKVGGYCVLGGNVLVGKDSWADSPKPPQYVPKKIWRRKEFK